MHSVELLMPATKRRGAHWTKLDLPGSWLEVSAEQLPKLAVLDVLVSNSTARRIEAFRVLTGLGTQDMARLVMEDLVGPRDVVNEEGNPVTLHELLPQLHWIESEPCYVTSLLPKLQHRGVEWSGPGDALLNLTVQRWGVIDEQLAQLVALGEITDTAERKKTMAAKTADVLGALYHRTGEPWTMAACDTRGAMLQDLQPEVKLAAVMNYKALRAMLPRNYPLCFSGGGHDRYGVHGMIVDLASSTAFAGIKTAEQALLHDVLIHCEKSLERDRSRKSHTPTA